MDRQADLVDEEKRRWTPPSDEQRCQRRQLVGYELLPRHERPFACGAYRVPGSQFCHYHTVQYMPRLYRVVNKRLADKLEALISRGDEQLQLREELAFTRVMSDEVVSLFEIAFEQRDLARQRHAAEKSEDSEKHLAKMEAVFEQACCSLRASHEEVRRAVLDAARVEALSSAGLTAGVLRGVLTQVTLIMRDLCGHSHKDLADEFARRVGDIEVTEREVVGTLLTPDQDARDMDQTVPKLVGPAA